MTVAVPSELLTPTRIKGGLFFMIRSAGRTSAGNIGNGTLDRLDFQACAQTGALDECRVQPSVDGRQSSDQGLMTDRATMIGCEIEQRLGEVIPLTVHTLELVQRGRLTVD